MAATVSAWSKPGAWALDSEENEAELIHQAKEELFTKSNVITPVVPESEYPSLSAAITTKTKKKKPQALSLQEFASYTGEKQSYTSPAARVFAPEENISLPTGPRERTAEELDRSRLGGGFRSFDSRGPRGSSDDTRRQSSFNREPRETAPSRADEIDNWAAGKKSGTGNGFERRERGERGGFFSDSQSRADEVDNWATNKAFVPSDGGRRFERRGGGFESNGGSGASDSDNWVKSKVDAPKFGGSFDSLRSRRGGNDSPDSDTWGRKREEVPNGGGAASGTTRPRLNLQPRTLPVPVAEVQPIEVKPVAEVLQIEVKPKGANPFGAARPREEVLKEKGQDWKEIDEKLESLKLKETAKLADSKRGFGNGPDDRSERAWRKPDNAESRPLSAEKSENGHVEENQQVEVEA